MAEENRTRQEQPAEEKKHPPMFSRDRMYKNVPFTVRQMDYIIAGILVAIVVTLVVGVIAR